MLVLNFIYILISIGVSFCRPTLFVCFYILFYTSYFGFVPNNILISGTDYGTFAFDMAVIIPLMLRTNVQKTIDRATIGAFLFCAIFILYGILKPYFDGSQDILMGIKASKSFLSYIILIYLMAYRRSIDFNSVFSFIVCVAFYFSFLYVVNYIGIRLIPPCYAKNDFLQCHYDSFIAFAIILLCLKKNNNGRVRCFYLKVFILMLGILIGGYFSLLITSLFLLVVFHMRLYCKSISNFIVCILFFFMLFFVISQVIVDTEVYKQTVYEQTNALSSRERYNEFRWKIIHDNFFVGSGFLYKSSALVKSLSTDGYSETFSFIDAGYVDLLGRFGIIGVIAFLLYPLSFLWYSFKDKWLFPLSLFIIQAFCVNYTWAVFSFPHGIILLSLTYSFITQNKENRGFEIKGMASR